MVYLDVLESLAILLNPRECLLDLEAQPDAHPEQEEGVDYVDEVLVDMEPQKKLSLDCGKEGVLEPQADVGQFPFPLFLLSKQII